MEQMLKDGSAPRIVRATATIRLARAAGVEAFSPAVLEFARAAGLLAAQNAGAVIPGCVVTSGLERAEVSAAVQDGQVVFTAELQCSGAHANAHNQNQMEACAMHAASTAAISALSSVQSSAHPFDAGVEITCAPLAPARAVEETSNAHNADPQQAQAFARAAAAVRCAVVVCSDSISAGKKEDRSGKAIIEKLRGCGIEASSYEIIPDEFDTIQHIARSRSADFDLVIFTGGTGLSPRDVTPEALRPLFDREIPGIMEAARSYGQKITPYAMLSRGVAGFVGGALVLALPGSTRGASQSMDALFPHVLHVFGIAKGMRHCG